MKERLFLHPEFRPTLRMRCKTALMIFAAWFIGRVNDLRDDAIVSDGWVRVKIYNALETFGCALFTAAYWGSEEEIEDAITYEEKDLSEGGFSPMAREARRRREEFAK